MGITQQIGASSIIKPGVIDNTAARPSSPYEGQVIFQKDTDQLLVWNGTAWVIPNSPAQNPQGLEFITSATIGTAVSSVTVSSAFSTTYDNYLIKITGMTGSVATDTIFQLGGITTGVYITSGFYQLLASATISTYTQTTTNMPIGTMATTQNTQINIEISAPNLAVTKYVQMNSASATLRANSATQIGSTVQATAFTITPASGTLTGGNITVYGYRKA